jgi:hypothetical protein
MSVAVGPGDRSRSSSLLGPVNQDERALTREAPNGQAFDARLERLVVLRFKYKTDLKAEFERMVTQEKIQNAIVPSFFRP